MPPWLSAIWYETCRLPIYTALTLGLSHRCRGGHHIPRSGPALLIANHQSFLDPIAIGVATERQLFYLARKTLFKPYFGALLRSVNCVPVDQEGVAKEGLKAILHQLHAGHAVLVFPEGERTRTGEMYPLKPGIQFLIRRGHAPVVPVGIAGAFAAYPRHRLLPRLSPLFMPATGATTAVVIGKPLASEKLAKLPREDLLAELFRAIQKVQLQAENLRKR